MRILLIEDEQRLQETITTGLEKANFTVDTVGTLAHARSALLNTVYDALILDLMLPDGDGLELLQALRRDNNPLPVLILTAKDAVDDRVTGLDRGADDYLVKPFAFAELVARLKALLRRPGAALGAVLVINNLNLDTIAYQANVDDTPLRLSRQEYAVLEQLMRREDRVVPRDVLEDRLYSIDIEISSNPIAVHIHHLRQRLATAGAQVCIHTVRGVGYWIAGT